MQAEHKLLLLCSKTRLETQDKAAIKELVGKGIDWTSLCQSSIWHKTTPLLYDTLNNIYPEIIPEAVLQELKTYNLENTAHNLLLSGTLIKILKIFIESDIDAVPFKGPVFSAIVFGDIGRRSYGDLDILVHQRDMYKAAGLLTDHGYHFDGSLTKSQFKKFILTENEVQLYHENNRVLVELHWEISGRYFQQPLDFDFFQNRLHKVTFLEKQVLQPSNEDLLVYLCIHGNQHYWEQLDAVCCIAELIRKRPELSWTRVVDIAKNIGCTRMLCIGLTLAKQLLNSNLPQDVIERIESDHKIPRLVDQVTGNLFLEEDITETKLTSRRFVAWHLITMDRKVDSMRYGLRLLTNPTQRDWEVFPLPASLSFLHYVLRPLRLIGEFGLRLFGSRTKPIKGKEQKGDRP